MSRRDGGVVRRRKMLVPDNEKDRNLRTGQDLRVMEDLLTYLLTGQSVGPAGLVTRLLELSL